MSWLKKFVSRKLLVALLTPLLLYINARMQFPLSEGTVKEIILVIIAYVIGQSVVDVASVIKNEK